MKVKEESEKVGLKLSIQKTKIMASGPIASWQIDGETGETVSDFVFWGSKITADGDCSHEIKRRLLLTVRMLLSGEDPLREKRLGISNDLNLKYNHSSEAIVEYIYTDSAKYKKKEVSEK